MLKLNRSVAVGAALYLFTQSITLAQSPKTDRQELGRIAQESGQRYARNYARAVEMAKQNNWPLFQKTKEGQLIALDGLDANGMPRYVITESNVRAAITTNTNQLWQGGTLGLNLNGGSTPMRNRLGMWEVGRPLTDHQEFIGRLSIEDPSGTASGATDSEHATHVGGTMVASGLVPSARGMANAANLRAWTSANDNAEMATGAAEGLLLSNHSYGIIAGWRFNSDRTGAADNPRWEWYGDTRISGREDWRFGFYDDDCREWDRIVYSAPFFLPVKSAGNFRNQVGPVVGQPYWQRTFSALTNSFSFQLASARPDSISNNDGYDILTSEANAKNTLVVGAVNPISTGYNQANEVQLASFTSWGPTDDGRIKPDLVANGVGLFSSTSTSRASYGILSGTSMAAPNASGSLFLLQEYYASLNNNNFMLAATLRGLAIHTTNEAGPAPGPDYQNGWGLLDAAKAASVIANRDRTHLLREAVLANGQTQTIEVVASGNGPLTVTICWTDPAGTPLAASRANLNNRAPRLVNDLDVRVATGAQTTLPWVLNPENPAAAATRGDNIRDNVEQIRIDNTVAGRRYTITVTHKGTLQGNATGQAYSLLASGVGGREYCVSAPTTSADSRLERMILSGLNHLPEPACATYSDFTNLSASVSSGQVLPLSVGLGTCAGNFVKAVRIFADWNGDGDFEDADEIVATSAGFAATETFTTQLRVPLALPVGRITRLRLVLQETNNPAGILPCGSYPKGETRDYSLLLTRPAVDVEATALLNPEPGFCASNRVTGITVALRNLGAAPLRSATITTVVTNAAGATLATLTGTFAGNLSSFQTANVVLMGQFNALPATAYTFRTTVAATDDGNPANNLLTAARTTSGVTPAPTNLTAVTCGADGNAILAGSGNAGTLYWYDAATGGNFLGAGERITTPVRPASGAYFAALNDLRRTGFGPTTKAAFPNGGYGQFGPAVQFTAQTAFVLESARLYIGNPGQVVLTLRDRRTSEEISETVIDVRATRSPAAPGTTTNDALDTGAVYNLNILFPRPGDYDLAIAFRNEATIFRNNELTAAQNPYPVALPGVVSITGNTAATTGGTSFANFYYYFYNLTIRAAGCASPRARVLSTRDEAPTAGITTSTGGSVICTGTFLTMTANVPTNTGVQWQRNGTNINGAVTPTLSVIEAGVYRILATNATGCSAFSPPLNVTTSDGQRPSVAIQGQVFTSSIATGNQWLRNGQPIAGAVGQTYNASEAGNYAVRVRVGLCDLTSDVIVLTSTEQARPVEYGLKLYPNPSTGRFTAEYASAHFGELQLVLFDLRGAEVGRWKVDKRTESLQWELTPTHLAAGMYVLQLVEKNQIVIKKIMITQ